MLLPVGDFTLRMANKLPLQHLFESAVGGGASTETFSFIYIHSVFTGIVILLGSSHGLTCHLNGEIDTPNGYKSYPGPREWSQLDTQNRVISLYFIPVPSVAPASFVQKGRSWGLWCIQDRQFSPYLEVFVDIIKVNHFCKYCIIHSRIPEKLLSDCWHKKPYIFNQFSMERQTPLPKE